MGLLGRFKRRCIRIRQKARCCGIILSYHRIADVNNDPFQLAVAPRRFREHMEVLRRLTKPVVLNSFASRRRSLGNRWRCAVTFDDGYQDVAEYALPILNAYDIPATIFVSSGCVQTGSEFWWDRLQRCLLTPGRLHWSQLEALDRKLFSSFHDSLIQAERYSQEDFLRYGSWTWKCPIQPTSRHVLFCRMYQHLQSQSAAVRDRLIDILFQICPDAPHTVDAHAMSVDELQALSGNPLIEIGSHTLNHVMLSFLDEQEQLLEVQEGKRTVERLIQRPVASFSYPHGAYTPATLNIARSAGVEIACTTRQTFVSRNNTRLELPRVSPEAWSGEQLEQWLRQVL